MSRSIHVFALAAFSLSLAGCYGPEPRPFAGRGGRSLDQPPRYGETNRYIQPENAPPPTTPRIAADSDIDPRTIPPGVDLTPPAGVPPPIDPGLSATPPSSTPAASPSGTPTPPPAGADTATTTPKPPPAGDAPYARPVPGKPGFVYSIKNPNRVIDVQGI
ncbi:MAG TPA: hypothetical protein VD994_05230, partial [Prosthecobacter sp.]|nr:hypothetical protein [Prosthecobacter sp.]